MQISLDPEGWLTHGPAAALPAEVLEEDSIILDEWISKSGTCSFRNLTSSKPSLRPFLKTAQVVSPQAPKLPEDSSLQYDIPENISWAHFSLGNVSGEALPPGEMPYNSTIWLNGSKTVLSAPFLNVGHGCSANDGFGSLGNCVCYKGQPISLDLLGEGRAICNTAPGYVWGFSSHLVQLGLAFEAAFMACCFICYLLLSLRGELLRKKHMRNAGPMKFALDFSEAVCDIEPAASNLSEDGIEARLVGINVGYRPKSAGEEQGGLRHRVVAGLERGRPLLDFGDEGVSEFEMEVRDWIDETWRRPRPTNREVYEDLNWHIYER